MLTIRATTEPERGRAAASIEPATCPSLEPTNRHLGAPLKLHGRSTRNSYFIPRTMWRSTNRHLERSKARRTLSPAAPIFYRRRWRPDVEAIGGKSSTRRKFRLG